MKGLVKSCTKYFCSSLILVIAVLVGIIANLKTKPDNITIDLENNQFSLEPLSEQVIENFHRDGVVLIRGLLSPQEAELLGKSVDVDMEDAPFSIFDLFGTKNYAKIMFDLWRTDEMVAKLSLQSLPQLAHKLGVGGSSDEIRLLRDAFFSYEVGGQGCGWHVDDEGFWPAQNDTSGVTMWIALDEMRVAEGGGLAAANGTHRLLKDEQSWIHECYQAIQGKTCAMETIAPECHAKLEDIKLQWDMQPGDAILWDRWSFHRTVVATVDGEEEEDNQRSRQRRYSVRYMPANAKAFGAVHHTVPQGGSFASPYYPQVWPTLIDDEVRALKHGLEGDVTPANIAKNLGSLLVQKVLGMLH